MCFVYKMSLFKIVNAMFFQGPVILWNDIEQYNGLPKFLIFTIRPFESNLKTYPKISHMSSGK